MNKIIFNYLIKNFLQTFLMVVLVFYCFGMILNLFEEIEFFKNINGSTMLPLTLSSIYIPSMLIKILPFIIFISSMWFMIKIRNNKDLLILKVFGYSNIKIFFILAFTSFLLGWIILFFINPVTSSMSRYYEQTKSKYSKDIDHLVTFNKNGLWIKEKLSQKQRIISATKPDKYNLVDVVIYHMDDKSNLLEKIVSKKANIKNNNWVLSDVKIYKLKDNIFKTESLDSYFIESIYDYEKINSLFKNFDTMSLLKVVFNFEDLIKNGYAKPFLNQSLHTMLSLPFYLFLMTALASVFTMNSLSRTDNFKLFIMGLITCVTTFYIKDLSLALGQTNRIPLTLSIWAPIIILMFCTFIGVFQINEK